MVRGLFTSMRLRAELATQDDLEARAGTSSVFVLSALTALGNGSEISRFRRTLRAEKSEREVTDSE
jgi:hypothetical protein